MEMKMLEIREKRLKKFTQDKDFTEKKKFTFNKNSRPESPKGQLISERTFWSLQIYQKTNEIFVRIPAIVSK